MRILITGAAGFIGGHLLDYLIKDGHEVVGIDNYSLGTYQHPAIVKADLLDKEYIDTIVKEFEPETVIHMAAWAHEGLSQFMPMKITENNYNAYLNILTPSIKYKVKRMIMASSMSVYGDQQPPFNEEMKRKPRDIYAIAKTAMEEATELLSSVYGFEYVIVRPHNVYGPRQSLQDPYRNVAAIFINRAMSGKQIYVYGDGEQKRAFSYIDDVTPYIAKLCFQENVKGQIVNVGPLEEFTVNHLADEVLKHFPDAAKPVHLPDRPLEVKHAYCTNDKATELLGYKTSTSFEDGVKQMIEWALSVGPSEFKYLDNLEIVNEKTPSTWTKKL